MSPRAAPVPLLIACALGIERLALRGRGHGAGDPVTVLRTGIGPAAAERTVSRVSVRAGPVRYSSSSMS
ncbi:hypothetical protein ABZ657_32745, partial [Streptomyces sp. NPDC007000]